jgi:hypothetical protein
LRPLVEHAENSLRIKIPLSERTVAVLSPALPRKRFIHFPDVQSGERRHTVRTRFPVSEQFVGKQGDQAGSGCPPSGASLAKEFFQMQDRSHGAGSVRRKGKNGARVQRQPRGPTVLIGRVRLKKYYIPAVAGKATAEIFRQEG